jgi:hypothetical protein
MLLMPHKRAYDKNCEEPLGIDLLVNTIIFSRVYWSSIKSVMQNLFDLLRT